MKIAFILFDGFSAFDFANLYEPLTQLKGLGLAPDLSWELCASQSEVVDGQGLRFQATQTAQPLNGFDLVVLPGAHDVTSLLTDDAFLRWLLTAGSTAWLAGVGNGALLLAAAGLLKGKKAASDVQGAARLADYGAVPLIADLAEDDAIFTASGSGSALRLGLALCSQLAGLGAAQKVQAALGVNLGTGPAETTALEAVKSVEGSRFARVVRTTRETSVEVQLDLDGSGQHTIQTGLPFLDHMLAQVAAHGLFDLDIRAEGDLQIDPHHTVEDVALALGEAFAKALGERRGILRMASASCPMDETLAWVVIDFSGRPYAVVKADWTAPELGGIATTLFTHFMESFAAQARCNLHAQVVYGRDDHHKAEALFKALGRALDAATQTDERRSAQVPSTKGVLF